VRQIRVSEGPVRCLAYSPDGKLLATGDEDNNVCLWSLPEGTLVTCVRDPGGSCVEALAFGPDGGRLAAGLARGDLVVWDLAANNALARADGHPGGVRPLIWLPGGATLVSAGWDRTLRLWTARLNPQREPIHTAGPVMALAATRDGQTLVATTNGGDLLLYRGPHLRAESFRHPHGLYSLAVAPSGSLAATGDAKGDIVLWRLPSGEQAGTLRGHEWTVYGLAFTPDGRTLVSGAADGTVRVWEVATGRLAETFRWHTRWVTCLGVSPDGMTAAAGSADGTLVVWDLADV
jgi:WD40 repeat protein